jgi:hypothetical protein
MDNFLTILYDSDQTVFTSKEIALLIGEKNKNNLKSKLAYYVKTGKLLRLRRGLFAKDKKYDENELFVRIYTPAYVSFETVLSKNGVTFQLYEASFVASYLSREISVAGKKVIYRKMKNEILANHSGLVNRGYYFEATKERAFLDRLYLFADYYFDNVRGIDWNVCRALIPLYKNRRLEKTFENYYKQYAQ